MNKKLRIVIKILYVYSLINGTFLALKFLTTKFENIKLLNIKHPIYLRNETSDSPTFKQVFLDNEYNIKFNKSSKTIIDGGANIGFFALKVKNELPNAKIICIEPDKDNFRILQKNLENYSNVFFENYDQAIKMGIEARKRVINEFDVTVLSKKNIEFYTSILKNQ